MIREYVIVTPKKVTLPDKYDRCEWAMKAARHLAFATSENVAIEEHGFGRGTLTWFATHARGWDVKEVTR